MKCLIAYTVNGRKNAKRHVYSIGGRRVYFDSLEQALNFTEFFDKQYYNVEVLTANWKKVEL